MSCIHQEFGSGKCGMFNEGLEQPGCDENGICVCSDDEYPEHTCEDYDSGNDIPDDYDEDIEGIEDGDE